MFGDVEGHPGWYTEGPFGIWKRLGSQITVVNLEPGYGIVMPRGEPIHEVEYTSLGEALEVAEGLVPRETIGENS